MKIFIDKRFIPKEEYQTLIDMFPQVEFVHDFEEHKDIQVFFGLNSLLESVDIDQYKNLKWIQLYMAGFDNVDVEGLKAKKLLVSNARDIFSITIAEDIIAKILFFNRNIKAFIENMETKTWQPIWKAPEIFGSTIGIIGTGSIGQETAKRLQSFSPKDILGHRRTDQPVDFFDRIFTGDDGLEEVIKNSDYLILAMPLNDETKYMIDREKLSLMKKNALLINIARGQVIVQEDLIDILENHQIRGAALDVTEPEPLPEDSKLWDLENVFITPHNASSSEYMVQRLFDLTLENLKLYLDNIQVKYLL